MEVAMGASIRRFGRIEPERPLLLAAWPGMGNVAYGAAAYLKDNLPLEKFAELDSVSTRHGERV
jgi:proteasome assembly chaperone (PAC2) family protein